MIITLSPCMKILVPPGGGSLQCSLYTLYQGILQEGAVGLGECVCGFFLFGLARRSSGWMLTLSLLTSYWTQS